MADLVGTNIRKLRQARNLRQKELADRADIDPSNLSKLERGEYTWTKENLERLAKALNVSVAAFFGDHPTVPVMGYVEAKAPKALPNESWQALRVMDAKLDRILSVLNAAQPNT